MVIPSSQSLEILPFCVILYKLSSVSKESQNTEFKQSWRDEYLKTICAFANTHGGTLFIGKDDRRKITGLEGAKKHLEDIPNKIVNLMGLVANVNLKREKGKDYISIRVKPYESPISFRGKYYIRSGSTTQELNGAGLQNFLLDKSGLTWDALPEERATMGDIDPKTIAEFKELAKKRFPAASKEKSVSGLLGKLHLLSKGKPTRAAILMFGKDPRNFYISSYIKIGRFKDESTLMSMDEVYGNLFQQVEEAMEVLKKKYLQTNIKIRTLRREEELEYPETALREAIVNAIVHRDYSATHTQIKIYPDQITIWNNGELSRKLTIAKLQKKHSSYPRNELIADVFYKASYIEAWGHGTVKMMTECKKAGLPEPLYEEDGGGMLVTFRKDIYTEESLQKLGLTDRQLKAVLFAKERGRITNREYQQLAGVKERFATMEMNELVSKGILQKIGTTGRGTYYAAVKAHKPQ